MISSSPTRRTAQRGAIGTCSSFGLTAPTIRTSPRVASDTMAQRLSPRLAEVSRSRICSRSLIIGLSRRRRRVMRGVHWRDRRLSRRARRGRRRCILRRIISCSRDDSQRRAPRRTMCGTKFYRTGRWLRPCLRRIRLVGWGAWEGAVLAAASSRVQQRVGTFSSNRARMSS